jgi:hypothetical protein
VETGGTKAADTGFNEFVKGVFNHLAGVFHDDVLNDLIYELGNDFYGGTPIRASTLVLNEIRWTTYDRYIVDMRDMLSREK